MTYYSSQPDSDAVETADAVNSLIRSSSKWMSAALLAWTEDDYTKVAVLAPLAVEHLGKAVLWQQNPVLVLPLNPGMEQSLFNLAIKANILDSRLRTIGLNDVLKRLPEVIGVLPIHKDAHKLLVEVRNGAMHVGVPTQSRTVLGDCLLLCQSLLNRLSEDEKSFYGDHYVVVQSLLSQKLSETGMLVMAKRTRAERRFRQVVEHLNDDTTEMVINRLQDDAVAMLELGVFVRRYAGLGRECPVCTSKGLLLGIVDGEAEPDWDVEKLGDGYVPVLMGFDWKLSFHPRTFLCTVCQLELANQAELTECDIAIEPFEVSEEDLGNQQYEQALEDIKNYGDL